jgi:acyl-CoA dehydrogenase-like protein
MGLTESVAIGIPPVINHGTKEQKDKWLPGIFACETSFCLGATEPTGGSDLANLRTTAQRTSDGKSYVVNGHKVRDSERTCHSKCTNMLPEMDFWRDDGNAHDHCCPNRWSRCWRSIRDCDSSYSTGSLTSAHQEQRVQCRRNSLDYPRQCCRGCRELDRQREPRLSSPHDQYVPCSLKLHCWG